MMTDAELKKLAFTVNSFTPIISKVINKTMKNSIREGIYANAAQHNIYVNSSDSASFGLPSVDVSFVPSPMPESDAPDAPTVIKAVPVINNPDNNNLNNNNQKEVEPYVPEYK